MRGFDNQVKTKHVCRPTIKRHIAFLFVCLSLMPLCRLLKEYAIMTAGKDWHSVVGSDVLGTRTKLGVCHCVMVIGGVPMCLGGLHVWVHIF